MAERSDKMETINQIVKEAKSLDNLDLRILLTKLRVKKIQREGIKPASKAAKGIKYPTMEEIDLWKHKSRKSYENRQVCT